MSCYNQFIQIIFKFNKNKINLKADEVELLVADLKQGKEYVMLVSAGNEMGFGEPATIRLTTSPLEQPQGELLSIKNQGLLNGITGL